jgi:hypothetical protein
MGGISTEGRHWIPLHIVVFFFVIGGFFVVFYFFNVFNFFDEFLVEIQGV